MRHLTGINALVAIVTRIDSRRRGDGIFFLPTEASGANVTWKFPCVCLVDIYV